MPKVSVCMPAHRENRWIRRAISSALSQSISDLELILTDDSGGELHSAAMSFHDPRISYHANGERLGLAGNHCRAIELCQGSIVAFLHDDDYWAPGYLQNACRILDANPRVGIVVSGAVEVDEADRPLGSRPTSMTSGVQAEPLKRLFCCGELLWLPSLSVFRASALVSNHRPWFDGVTADTTMFIDALTEGWELYHDPAPRAYYRIHAGQAVKDRVAHRSSMVELWDRYAFLDPELESLRRSHLAGVLIGRAGAFLREGKPASARQDLYRARQEDYSRMRVKRQVLGLFALLPPRLLRALDRIWDKVHNPVRRRHITDVGALRPDLQRGC